MKKKFLLLWTSCIVVFTIFSSPLFAFQVQSKVNVNGAEYFIEFTGFNREQLASVEAFYKQFQGYEQHIVLKQQSRSLGIRYVSEADLNLLLNNFRKTFEHLGFEVLIRSADQQISVQFIKLTPKSIPYQQW